MNYPLHLEQLLRAPKVSGAAAKSLIKKGWFLRELDEDLCYCSFGAAGRYTHFLHDGGSELRQLTTKAVQSLEGVQATPFELDIRMLVLSVPMDDIDRVKALKGVWSYDLKHWLCMPGEQELFKEWLIYPHVVITGVDDKVLLDIPRSEVEQAKQAGAFRSYTSEGVAGWFALTGMSDNFYKWIPK